MTDELRDRVTRTEEQVRTAFQRLQSLEKSMTLYVRLDIHEIMVSELKAIATKVDENVKSRYMAYGALLAISSAVSYGISVFF